ncbi:MAG: branched-chain amino acid ABC transporter permease [Alphaproteobacteria bacterium]
MSAIAARQGAAGGSAWRPLATAVGWLVLAAGLLALPHLLSISQRELAVLLLVNILLVASYRLITLTGEWSLGHVVMMGVGGYGSALLASLLGLPVVLAMAGGAAVTGLVAWLLSFPLFRMKGFYFLIGSFAAAEVIRLCWKKFTVPFGGPKGLTQVPALPDLHLGGLADWLSLRLGEPGAGGQTGDYFLGLMPVHEDLLIRFSKPLFTANYYYFCLVVVAASLWLLWRVERSRIGMTFHAIHWQDSLAASVGVDTRRYRTLALVIGSAFAGLAGALMAHGVGSVSPNRFDVAQMVYVLIWVIVGGTATFAGPIVGVIALTILNEVVLRELDVEALRPAFYGGILILSVLFLPRGLEGAWTWRRRGKGKTAAEQSRH